MRTFARSIVLVLFFAVCGLGHIVSTPAEAASETTGILRALSNEVAEIAEKARPAVVSVRSTTIRRARRPVSPLEQMELDQLDRFFGPGFRDRFFPQRQRDFEYRQQGLGSGFIIDPTGVILTNNHVVMDMQTRDIMEDIKVILSDGREFKATVLGTDPETEVAVIKIDGNNLPVLALGDSDKLKVGNIVLAIGSPQGLQFAQSVTMGIVSALDRSLGITAYDTFIQTDAAINRGNSGGPLLNCVGEVIGINTAIISASGGSEGLGLAIPINKAKKVADILRTEGRVRRGYLGLGGEDIDPNAPEIAEFLGTRGETGIIVTQIVHDKPAAKAGIQLQDVITRLNGQPFQSYDDFRNRIAEFPPGTSIRLHVIRDGRGRNIDVTLAERPGFEQPQDGEEEIEIDESQELRLEIGFSVRPLTPEIAEALGYPGRTGLVITQVDSTSNAARQGLRPRMLITEVNRQKVQTNADMQQALEKGADLPSVFLLLEDPDGGARLIIIPKD